MQEKLTHGFMQNKCVCKCGQVFGALLTPLWSIKCPARRWSLASGTRTESLAQVAVTETAQEEQMFLL